MSVSKYFRKQLREEREKKNYSRRDVADLTGISEATVYAIERGSQKPNLEHYAKFLELFDIPIYPKQHFLFVEQEKIDGTEQGTDNLSEDAGLSRNNNEIDELYPDGTDSLKDTNDGTEKKSGKSYGQLDGQVIFKTKSTISSENSEIAKLDHNLQNGQVRPDGQVNGTVPKMGEKSPDGLEVKIIETSDEDIAMIPELDVNFAAGTGAYPPDHNLAIGVRAFSLSWLQKKMLKPQNLRLVRVMGDSMAPLLHDKDMVMIELGRPPTSAMPVAFRLENELYIKSYQPQGDGTIKMKSRNKAYDTIIINPKSPPDDFAIIGCVVWQSHSYI